MSETEQVLTPAAVWPVWSYVKETMESNGWDEDELLRRMGHPRVAHVTLNNVKQCQRLNGLDVRRLGRAFGTSFELWEGLDRAFWEALESQLYYLTKDEPSHD